MAVSLCVVSNGTRSILVVKLAFHAAGCKEIFLTRISKEKSHSQRVFQNSDQPAFRPPSTETTTG